MINLIDTFATVIELIEATPSPAGNIAPDSISFCNTMLHPNSNKEPTRPSMVTANAQGILAIRQGPYKYIEGRLPDEWPENKQANNFDGQAVRQLYNLNKDPAEQNNIIATNQERAKKLEKQLNKIRK